MFDSVLNLCASSIKIFLYLLKSLFKTESNLPIDSKCADTLKSRNTFFQEPGLFSSSNIGGANTRIPPSNCLASIAEIYVFPKPTTSERKTPPYSSRLFLALSTDCSWYSNFLNLSGQYL